MIEIYSIITQTGQHSHEWIILRIILSPYLSLLWIFLSASEAEYLCNTKHLWETPLPLTNNHQSLIYRAPGVTFIEHQVKKKSSELDVNTVHCLLRRCSGIVPARPTPWILSGILCFHMKAIFSACAMTTCCLFSSSKSPSSQPNHYFFLPYWPLWEGRTVDGCPSVGTELRITVPAKLGKLTCSFNMTYLIWNWLIKSLPLYDSTSSECTRNFPVTIKKRSDKRNILFLLLC